MSEEAEEGWAHLIGDLELPASRPGPNPWPPATVELGDVPTCTCGLNERPKGAHHWSTCAWALWRKNQTLGRQLRAANARLERRGLAPESERPHTYVNCWCGNSWDLRQ